MDNPNTAGFLGGSVIKNLPANAREARDAGSIPGLGRSPGGGHGNPLQYSCLENPMDREAYSLRYRKESDMTESLTLSLSFKYM